MISIIICSRRKNVPVEMQNNIALTIGCGYEHVIIDNSTNKYSIFQAYNEGVRRAKGDILCFVHDDVLFRTENWGRIISEMFVDSTIGLLGFAGSHFMPSVPMYWSESPIITEYNLHNDEGVIRECFQEAYLKFGIVDGLVCDGFCFFIPAHIFNQVSFDEKIYKGFHMYDMDICMQIFSKGKRIVLTNKILIEHFWSERLANKKQGVQLFTKNLDLFYNKWNHLFPLIVGVNIPTETFQRINRLCIQAYDAKVARRSSSYRLGHLLLSPFKWLQHKLK